MNIENIRVRFAPSPTGYLHIGGLRTALYNYLLAKHNKGKFILRIEDTDRNRFVEGAVANLIDTLNWAGLEYDEGPDIGGEFGPYMQSERLDLYRDNIKNLLQERKAYPCFCTQERLNEVRDKFQKEGLQPMYDKHCLYLSETEVKAKIADGIPYVVRLNVEPEKQIILQDVIRGEVVFNSSIVDDQILIKSDSYPTYHFANVVDDHFMKITHVIRGEEWLSSTPKHILLYDYFGWDKPVFAHLPLLLNPDRSKLSKRQGDVAVEDYRRKGYLKDALINFVALLGWNFADDKEYYLMNELIEKFSLEGVNKAGAVFNLEKLNWLNAEHLRKKPLPELILLLREELETTKYKVNEYTDEFLGLVIEAMKERVSFMKEIPEKGNYLFEDPSGYDDLVVKKRWKPDSSQHLRKLSEEFSKLSDPSKEDFENALRKTSEVLGVATGELIHPLRLAVSGVGGGPGVFDICRIIGKEKTILRLNNAIEKLG
jgi:glutamyl-tRNA synthetase